MLLITVETEASAVTVRFDGCLAGPDARDLAENWTATRFMPRAGRRILFDLTSVTDIDAAGVAFLTEAHRNGGTLIGGATTRAFVDAIVAGRRTNDAVW